MSLMRMLSSPIAYFLPSGRRPAAPVRVSRRRPPIGTTICCNQFRMSVQAGMTRELWHHLIANGWRELPAGASRYQFRAMPSNVVAALIDAPADEWDRLLVLGFRRAQQEQREALAA